MTKPLRTALAFALMLPAAAAFAGADKFASMDTDGDGRISGAEHAVGASKMFQKIDADNSGSVTAAEMDAAHAKWAADEGKAMTGKMSSADKIAKIDGDGDGALTAAEHAEGAKSMFAKMDRDNDGSLTKDELEIGHKAEMADNR